MSILSVIMGVETGGGRNITQGEIGDINNRTGDLAQGYYQITGATWRDFGGAKTGYNSAIQAPYGTQLQVAQNIPVQRWGPRTQTELRRAGYKPLPGETLGGMLNRYGEDPAATRPIDGASVTPGMAQGPSDYTIGGAGQPGGVSGATFVGEGDHISGTGVNGATGGAAGDGSGGMAGGGMSGTGGAMAGTGMGMPLTVGLQSGLAAGIQQWIDQIASGVWQGVWKSVSSTFLNIQNWFIRAFVIIVGLVILAVGLMKVTGTDDKIIAVIGGAARRAA